MTSAAKQHRSETEAFVVGDAGAFPNNERLPVVMYRSAFSSPDPADIEDVLASNYWGHGWRAGVFDFHHYHSTAHEVLVCYSGSAKIQLGGPDGRVVEVHPGDGLVLPAGVSHKRVETTGSFRVVGCYPDGQDFDMMYGHEGERPAADERIAQVPAPEADPIYGEDGPLVERWG